MLDGLQLSRVVVRRVQVSKHSAARHHSVALEILAVITVKLLHALKATYVFWNVYKLLHGSAPHRQPNMCLVLSEIHAPKSVDFVFVQLSLKQSGRRLRHGNQGDQ